MRGVPDTTPHCADVPRWTTYEKVCGGQPSSFASALFDMMELRGARLVRFPLARLRP